MNNVPRISDAEWEVMKVLWAQAPCTANDVIEALRTRTDWNPKTVRTLLTRLTQKNAIAYAQENRVYTYYPLVSEADSVQVETHSFLKRMHGGAFKPLLMNFLKEERLSAEDIQELKALLDDQNKTK
jgi:BlaI family penicillinase repressor